MSFGRPLASIIALMIVIPSILLMPGANAGDDRSDLENFLTENWSGENVINLTEALCEISFSHPAYRVSGSEGAEEAADFIASALESYGLQVAEENFTMPVWTLRSAPSLVLDPNGSSMNVGSFQSESYSLPTAEGGVDVEMVSLPLPYAADRNDIGSLNINETAWNEIDITGKAVLIGKEVRWYSVWEQVLKMKLYRERPAAVVFRYSYDWNSFADNMSQASAGGVPLGNIGPIFWDYGIPAGFVDYREGAMLAQAIGNNSVAVHLDIPSVVSEGTHRNIVAEVPASSGEVGFVVLGAHYDTVLCEGYVDNTAGVATMLETARLVQMAKEMGVLDQRYAIRFIAFDAEELGLAGSIHYVFDHQAELGRMVAVMVVDSIGSHTFKVTDAISSGGFDLNVQVESASEMLGTTCLVEPLGASDHSSFMNPTTTSRNYNYYWRDTLDLREVSGVPNTMLFYSTPLSLFDEPYGPYRGHIHTHSDSREGVGSWIYIEDLKEQSKMVTLTAMLSISSEPDLRDDTWIYAVVILVAITALVIYMMQLSDRPERPRP